MKIIGEEIKLQEYFHLYFHRRHGRARLLTPDNASVSEAGGGEEEEKKKKKKRKRAGACRGL